MKLGTFVKELATASAEKKRALRFESRESLHENLSTADRKLKPIEMSR